MEDIRNTRTGVSGICMSLAVAALNPESGPLEADKAKLKKLRDDIAEINRIFIDSKVRFKDLQNRMGASQKILLKRECDISFGVVKIKALTSCCGTLEHSFKEGCSNLTLVQDQLSKLIENHLARSLDFMAKWNCTPAGLKYQMDQIVFNLNVVKEEKSLVEKQLSEFLKREDEYNAAVADRENIEQEIQKENALVTRKEQMLLTKIQEVRKALEQLYVEQDKTFQDYSTKKSRLLVRRSIKKVSASQKKTNKEEGHSFNIQAHIGHSRQPETVGNLSEGQGSGELPCEIPDFQPPPPKFRIVESTSGSVAKYGNGTITANFQLVSSSDQQTKTSSRFDSDVPKFTFKKK